MIRKRRLFLDVMFCPAIKKFPEIYKDMIDRGYSPDSFRFCEDLENSGAMMPLKTDKVETISELLEKTERMRKVVSADFPCMLLDITSKSDLVKDAKNSYIFTYDYEDWFEMDKRTGDLEAIKLMDYFKMI